MNPDSLNYLLYIFCMVIGALIIMLIAIRYFKDHKMESSGIALSLIALILLLSPFWTSVVFEMNDKGVKVAIDKFKNMEAAVQSLSEANDALEKQIAQVAAAPAATSPEVMQNRMAMVQERNLAMKRNIVEVVRQQEEVKRDFAATRFKKYIKP
jgi:hypothetical protein